MESFTKDVVAVKKKRFYFYTVNNMFNHTAMLSLPDLDVDLKRNTDGYFGYVQVGTLFDFDISSIGQDVRSAMQEASQKDWPPEKRTMTFEWEVAVAVAECFLGPLCSHIEIEPSYEAYIGESRVVRLCNLGIGKRSTWHGVPDMRVRGIPVVVRSQEEAEVREEEEGEVGDERSEAEDGGDNEIESGSDDADTRSSPSHGASTLVEAKVRIGWTSSLPQLVKTCVVSSFVEHSLYPQLQAMVPTILIGLRKFRVCLYSCTTDILYISRSVNLATETGKISTRALLFMWVVINHRQFLQCKEPASQWKSKILDKLRSLGCLQEFESLKRRDIDWNNEVKKPRVSVERNLSGGVEVHVSGKRRSEEEKEPRNTKKAKN